ncbi:monocarboxylate transporter 13-like [Ruditapes philippinarum]|uniref:monocarboxylate transporter 13-like n=1 Tax=Ruditapes philippinarum TaxID=129788 RepID=UPI00295C324C|nr:monocarboxylate transporter 13-like [Ruditapes philippinarum]
MLEVKTGAQEQWRWVVLTGAFCCHAITYGIVYSFGILFIALEERFEGSKTEIAWIPSLTTGLLHSSGLLASILVKRFGCRIVTISGAIICCVGYILSIFVPNVYILYLTMGLVSGCGFGMVFLPAVLIVTQYFTRLRSVACGIALSGCGIGVFIFSPVMKLLLDLYSLDGTLLILSAVILNYIPCGLVFRPISTKLEQNSEQNVRKRGTIDEVDFGANISLLNNDSREVSATSTEATDVTVVPKTSDETDNLAETHNYKRGDSTDKTIVIEQTNKCQVLQSEKASTFELTKYLIIMKRKEVFIFMISQFLFIFGFYLPFIFIPDMAKSFGISESSSAWVASVIGISSTCGRIILGYIADRPSINRLCMFKVTLLLTGLSTSLCPVFEKMWLLLTYGVVFGVSAGFNISVTSVVILDFVGLEYLTEALGLASLFGGIGSVLGPPFSGLLFDLTGSYTAPFLVSGGSMSLAAILMFNVSFCSRTYEKYNFCLVFIHCPKRRFDYI